MNDDSLLKLYADLSDLERIRRFVEDKVDAFQVGPSDIYGGNWAIKLAVTCNLQPATLNL